MGDGVPGRKTATRKGTNGSRCSRSRSRSPAWGKLPQAKGEAVQFFFEIDPADKKAALVKPEGWKKGGARLLQSHGWFDGTLDEAFDPATFDPEKSSTWPSVAPKSELSFRDRSGGKTAAKPMRVRRIRKPSVSQPRLSVVLVRWNGEYSKWMDEQEANDGDWGKYGSPPSDEYMTALVSKGFLAHPTLAADEGHLLEVFHLFVESSEQVWELSDKTEQLTTILKGKSKSMFWMLWPAEWEDTGDPDFACYIERQALFSAQRACEAAGLPSGFPHPADQFELITSKSWMATLSLHPLAHLPACVLVSKEQVVNDLSSAARDALASMEHIRKVCPFPNGADDPPAPSEINRNGIKKGVVKLGWSWENRFVSVFEGEKQLQERLKTMMSQPGCTASSCIVQEFVDFDFEMRLYFLPPPSWEPGTLKPARVECNAWGPRSGDGEVGRSHASFSKLSEADALELWDQDTVAWEAAKAKATEISQFLLAWLLASNARAVPMIRLDFMQKRLRAGTVRVAFGEYCEMGACCLGWKDGPPTIWRAAIDAAMR